MRWHRRSVDRPQQLVNSPADCSRRSANGLALDRRAASTLVTMKPLKPVQIIACALLSRWSRVVLHLLLIHLLWAAGTSEFVADLFSGSSKMDWKTLEHELIEVIEGLAVVLIGYGVALEERESFREMAGLIGQGDEVFEQALDKMAHHAGVWLVVLGLFSEVAIKLVEFPNTIVDTSLGERPLMMVAAAKGSGGKAVHASEGQARLRVAVAG